MRGRRIRGNIEAPTGRPPVYQLTRSTLPLWDLTYGPSTNNRDLKIGTVEGGAAMAVLQLDGDRRTKIADGFLNMPGYNTRRPFEPDNFILRPHVAKGKGRDVVWALRMVADHENHNAERTCRSTWVIDQGKKQCQAFLSDLCWVQTLSTEIKHDEMAITGAGYLQGLGTSSRGGFRPETATGKKTRAALMQNHAKNAGFFTDGKFAASLWHLYSAMPLGAGGGVPGEMEFEAEGPGQTQAEASGPGGGCKEPKKWHGALRGDVNYDMEGIPVHLAVGKAYETGGDLYSGMHWIHKPSPKPPRYEPQKDPKSNHEVLDRKLDRGLWVYVAVHRNDWVPPVMPGPMMGPSGPTLLASGAGPDASAGGSGDAGDWRPPLPCFDSGQAKLIFPQSYITYETFTIQLPEYGSEIDLRIKIPYTLPSNLAGGEEMEFRLFYKLYLSAGQTIGTTWTELTKTIDSGDNPSGATQVRWLVFEINKVGLRTLQQKGGGRIFCYFLRRSDDGVAKNFHMLGNVSAAYKPAGAKNPAFEGVA